MIFVIFEFITQIFEYLWIHKFKSTSSRFSRDSMSNQAGILKPRFSVMGITGAVGQITLAREHWMDSDWLTINLEMVRSDCIEDGRPTMASVAKAVQKYHGSSLNERELLRGSSERIRVWCLLSNFQKGSSDDMIYQKSYAINSNQKIYVLIL